MKFSLALKKNNKWITGYLDGNKFYFNKEFKKLSEIKELSDYKKIETYLKDDETDIVDKIKRKLESDSIYILEKPVYPVTESNEFNDYWWSDINILCKDCEKECKQSDKVIVESCKSYRNKGE